MPTSPIIRARGISSWCRLPASNDLRRRIVVTIAAFGAIAAAACLAAPLVGTTPIALSRVFDRSIRSEEHTSELQSRFDLVCRLLLEKKKKQKTEHICLILT